ncbi:NAD-dependent protein deacetylase sirtuin-2-like isoform X1 [Mya arenaria]|nr:NAD-dependent protein deacetylase sirtuin-2-like isoform X1 [Mya arenaria]
MASEGIKKDEAGASSDGGASSEESKKPGLLEQTTSSTSTSAEWLSKMFTGAMKLEKEEKPPSLLDAVTFEGIARYILSDKCKKIVTMAGAGISTSAGIPDFRSPGTGLYDNLQKYNLPNPQAVFDISYFRENPEPFFILCKQLYPTKAFKPTPCHYFIKLLEKKGKLLTHFTQNIDTLERVTDLSDEKLVEAHGTFNTGHCTQCLAEYGRDWMRDEIFSERKIPKCTKEECNGVVKPDIVFFGECLPKKFSQHIKDVNDCDLLIIMGTSLVVHPFASLTSRTRDDVPRLYINMTNTEKMDPLMALLGGGGGDFDFDNEDNIRDVFWQGTCDDGCQALADLLGWGEELKKLVKEEHARIDKQNSTEEKTVPTKAKV